MVPSTGARRQILIVGWYPSADDPAAGRFVADQAGALAASGRVATSVVSFEPFGSSGDRALRSAAAAIWPGQVRRAMADPQAIAPAAVNGPPGVPLLRLGVTGGTIDGAGFDNQAVHRSRALAAAMGSPWGEAWSLIHVHVGYPEGVAVAAVARHLGIPYVVTEHLSYLDRVLADPVQAASYRDMAGGAAYIVAVSQFLRDKLVAFLPDLAHRIVVIPNAVDTDAFHLPGPGQRRANELLYVGHRSVAKGLPILLEAFARLRADAPDLALRLIGTADSPTQDAVFQAAARDLGVGGAVTFEGPTDRAGVAAAMARATVFVHPSPRETFGMVAVEALAAGLPVASVDVGAVREIFQAVPGSLGVVASGSDAAALARAVAEVLARRSSFDPVALREVARVRFGASAVARRLVDLYASVAPPAGRSGAVAPPAAPTGAPIDRPIVIVAFDRPALDEALRRWPTAIPPGATIVSRGDPFDGGRALSPAIDRDTARLMAWGDVHEPAHGVRPRLRAAARRRRRARLEQRVLPALGAAVAEAATELGRRSGSRPLVVCRSGLDIIAAAPLAEAGQATLAPGGLRWLADASRA